MKTPIKIEQCPIKDIIIEIRFESTLFSNAVFGVLYNSLSAKFPNVEQLPILQIPANVLEADPAFKYKTHYKLSDKDNYSVQVGPEAIVIGAPMPYEGWSILKDHVFDTLRTVFGVGIITKVSRLGIRVINVFDGDVFDRIKLKLQVGDYSDELDNSTIRTQVKLDGFTNTIQIAKNVEFKAMDGTMIIGSMIDIDTFKEYTNNSFLDSYKDEIDNAHMIEKKIFFGVLEREFIDTLKPTYD